MKKSLFLIITSAILYSGLLHNSFASPFNDGDKIELDSVSYDVGLTFTYLKENFTYDFYGRVLYHYRSSKDNDLLHEQEYSYEYLDDEHKVIMTLKKDVSGTRDLQLAEKNETFLNENGLVTEIEKYKRNNILEEWNLIEKDLYTYNEKGNKVSSSIYKIVDETGLLKLYRTDTIEYNAFDKPEYITQKQLSGVQLKNLNRTKFIYKSDTILQTKFKYVWNILGEVWVVDKRYKYSYDNQTKIIVLENWIYNQSEFVKQRKFIDYYNNEGDVSVHETYLWNPDENDWNKWMKKDYSLNYETVAENIIRPKTDDDIAQNILYDNITHKGKITGVTLFDVQDGEWSELESYTYYYSAFTPQSVNKKPEVQLSVYPNPAIDFLNIKSELKFSQFKIYSMDGHLIKSGELYSNCLDISSVPSGTYLLKLESSKGKQETIGFVKN